MVALFASADLVVTREQISQWLKKDNDQDFVSCHDIQLAVFLNGFINNKRGKKEGPKPTPEKRLTNNIILTKLKIALNLKAEDIIDLLNKVDFRLSKPELSAFSRKPDHKHYRECKDQVLRNLLQAIDKTYHVERTVKFDKPLMDDTSKQPAAQNASKGKYKGKAKSVNKEPHVQGARPKVSAIYENPNKKTPEKEHSSRQMLKLKPEEIWKKSPK